MSIINLYFQFQIKFNNSFSFVVSLHFGEEFLAGLLGVPQQHTIVGFVEHWVIDGSIPNPHGSLHHDTLFSFPYL